MRRLATLGLLAVLIIVGLWFVLRGGEKEVSSGETGVAAVLPKVPDFSFPDASGKEVVLSEVTSQLRIVHFWASWDPSSAEALRSLAAIEQDYGTDVTVVALNRDAVPADGEAYLERLGLGEDLVFAYDKNDTYYRELGGYNMPETVFVGSGGEILHHAHGPMEPELQRATVADILE